jgi:hypothetical protein
MKQDSMTHPQLEVISGFLRHFDLPAVGHSGDELTADERRQIEALANGELGPAERQRLVPFLSANDQALAYLARLAKGAT